VLALILIFPFFLGKPWTELITAAVSDRVNLTAEGYTFMIVFEISLVH